MTSPFVAVCVLGLVSSILGCAETGPAVPLGREKIGASVQEFTSARYSCLQESSSRVSGAAVNAYGGSASSAIACNYQLYDACMIARGFYVTNYGRFQAPVTCVR